MSEPAKPNPHSEECRKAFRAFREAKDKLVVVQQSCSECESSRRKHEEAKQTLIRR
jgi:hypothetical protein